MQTTLSWSKRIMMRKTTVVDESEKKVKKLILKAWILDPYCNIVIAEISWAAFHAFPVVEPISLALQRGFFLWLFTLWCLTAVLWHKVDAIPIWNPVTWNCQKQIMPHRGQALNVISYICWFGKQSLRAPTSNSAQEKNNEDNELFSCATQWSSCMCLVSKLTVAGQSMLDGLHVIMSCFCIHASLNKQQKLVPL